MRWKICWFQRESRLRVGQPISHRIKGRTVGEPGGWLNRFRRLFSIQVSVQFKHHPTLIFHISVYIPWDVEEYYRNHVQGGRDKKRMGFPNPMFGTFSKPLTLVDVKGRIVLWYLPGLLSAKLLVSVYEDQSPNSLTYFQQSELQEATLSLTPLLKKSIKEEIPQKPPPNWRINEKNFVQKTHRHLCEPGSVTFSAGWFGQGHAVRS